MALSIQGADWIELGAGRGQRGRKWSKAERVLFQVPSHWGFYMTWKATLWKESRSLLCLPFNCLTERNGQELECLTLRQIGRCFVLKGLGAAVTLSPSDRHCPVGWCPTLQSARLWRSITSSRTFPLEKLMLSRDSIVLWWSSHCRDSWSLYSPFSTELTPKGKYNKN